MSLKIGFSHPPKEELKNILKENPRLNEEDFILPRRGIKTLPMILYTMQGCRDDFFLYEKNYYTIYSEAWKNFHDPSNKPMAGKSPIKSMTDLILARDKRSVWKSFRI